MVKGPSLSVASVASVAPAPRGAGDGRRFRCRMAPSGGDLSRLDEGAAAPIFPKLSEQLLRPMDRLVGQCLRCAPEKCEVQYMDTGAISGAPSPNNGEDVIQGANELEEGKASPTGAPTLNRQVAATRAEQRLRRYLQGIYLVLAAVVIIICYYFHLFTAESDLGVASHLQCRSSLFRYSTVFGGSTCGLWGQECLPGNQWMLIRCPGLCGYALNDALDTHVIGGGGASALYRADSRICLAAWHAGFVKSGGGCVEVRVTNGQTAYEPIVRHGIESLAFNSWYPFGLEFREASGARNCGYDHTPVLLLLNVLLLVGFLSLRPSRRVFFWCMITSMWWYCALISPMDNKTIRMCFAYFGRFAYFVFGAEVLLWHVGHAKCTFPDTTSSSSFLRVILIELLPLVATLHWHFLSVFGSYSLNGALFQSWEGPVTFMVGLGVLLPVAIGVLRDWYRAKLLIWLLRQVFCFAVLIVALTLIFSTSGWGLHLHHYFIGLFCYIASRGQSNCSALARALCLGALINGLAFWGETHQVPIWAEGAGWYPPSGSVDLDAFGNHDQVVFTAAERVNGTEDILLRWSFVKDLGLSNCSLDSVNAQDGSMFVVEMNHIEIYRGPARAIRLRTPNSTVTGSNASRFYLRVGRIGQGLSRGVISATQVLAIQSGDGLPALTWPYESTADDCQKTTTIIQQPEWTLDGYV